MPQHTHDTEQQGKATKHKRSSAPIGKETFAFTQSSPSLTLQRVVVEPGRATPGQMRALQRIGGNRAVVSLLRPASTGVVQRDIAAGKPLPKLANLTHTRFSNLLGGEMRAVQGEADELVVIGAKQNIKDMMFMMGVLRQVNAEKQKDETDATWDDVQVAKDIIQSCLIGAKDGTDLRQTAQLQYFSLQKSKLAGPMVMRIINAFVAQTRKQANQVAAYSVPLDRSERKYKRDATTSAEVANAFLEARKNVNIAASAQEYETQKSAFAAALKKMPIVKTILEGHKKGNLPAGGDNKWKTGGKMSDDITESKVNEARNEKGRVIRTNVKNGKFKKRVDRADQFIRAMVEPQLLSELDRPKVVVHLKYKTAFRKIDRFRAYQSGSTVHVAQDEGVPVIVHEVSHYLEDNLPSELWHDIRLMMEKRHKEAGGGTLAVKGDAPGEGGYAGKYLDIYMAKAYGGEGGTEVMSMTMEYLANPSKAAKMIEGDPQQAAIILRGIRPKEYAATSALRSFDKFLPQDQSRNK